MTPQGLSLRSSPGHMTVTATTHCELKSYLSFKCHVTSVLKTFPSREKQKNLETEYQMTNWKTIKIFYTWTYTVSSKDYSTSFFM